MNRMVKYFFEGLLILVPIAATVYIIYFIFTTVDGWLKMPVPGVGFLITIGFITLIGFLASNIFTRRLLRYIESIFTKPPVVKLVYISIKDLIGAFVGDKKSFDQPVVVTLMPGSNTKVIGFITKEDLTSFGLSDHVAVYVPQAYNFAGNLLIFARDQVKPLQADSAEVMAFIVSGGVSGNRSQSD